MAKGEGGKSQRFLGDWHTFRGAKQSPMSRGQVGIRKDDDDQASSAGTRGNKEYRGSVTEEAQFDRKGAKNFRNRREKTLKFSKKRGGSSKKRSTLMRDAQG